MENAALSNMSVNDLNQRYGETYVKYKDTPVFLYNFFDGKGIRKISYITLEQNGGHTDQETETFNWRALDCIRLRSKWYKTVWGCFYPRLYAERQWKRGLRENIVGVFSKKSIDFPKVVYMILKENEKQVPKTYGLSLEKLVDKNTILSPHLFVSSSGEIFYRTTKVGIFDKETMKLSLIYSFIKEELEERLDVYI